jgi:hypothetical protein
MTLEKAKGHTQSALKLIDAAIGKPKDSTELNELLQKIRDELNKAITDVNVTQGF